MYLEELKTRLHNLERNFESHKAQIQTKIDKVNKKTQKVEKKMSRKIQEKINDPGTFTKVTDDEGSYNTIILVVVSYR